MTDYDKYDQPSDILDDNSLTKNEKLTMLKRWREDENALIRAASEGMESEERPNHLKAVKKALLSLEGHG